jgi:hypothetical protein
MRAADGTRVLRRVSPADIEETGDPVSPGARAEATWGLGVRVQHADVSCRPWDAQLSVG